MADQTVPFFLDLQRRVDELFDELVYRRWPARTPPEWRPPVDVFELPGGYQLTIDLPGVRPHDITLIATERTLTVAGQLTEHRPEGVVSFRRERNSGPFRRSIEFGESILPAEGWARYHHGTVVVWLPKLTTPRSEYATLTSPIEIRLVLESNAH